MTNAIIEKAKERFAHSHESLAREFGSIRALIASPAAINAPAVIAPAFCIFSISLLDLTHIIKKRLGSMP